MKKGTNNQRPRTAIKSNRIMAHIREKILAGRLRPGQSMPLRIELADQYGVSINTIQRAMDELRRDGFVVPRGKLGTFVAEKLPCESRYAMTFFLPSSGNRFWTSLEMAAREVAPVRGAEVISVCYDEGRANAPGFQRLIEDVQAHRIGGIISIGTTRRLLQTPVMDEPYISRVSIISGRPDEPLPTVHPRSETFLDRALDDLLESGCGRLAVLGCFPSTTLLEETYDRISRRTPLDSMLLHHVDPYHSFAGCNLAQMMMNLPDHKRPDSLIIADDNLVEQVTLGLSNAGVRGPDDLRIVAHANYPYSPVRHVPARLLGFDSRQMVAHALDLLESIRGKTRQERMVRSVGALFENEVRDGAEARIA